MNAFGVVRDFEKAVAEFAGAKYGVAVNSCTSALFLSLKYAFTQTTHSDAVMLPAHTFISVPFSVIHAGKKVAFEDYLWDGVYKLDPYEIWDGALRFKRGMYKGGLHCLSFQARKILNIGEGGMILTDDDAADEWLRAACYCGRKAPDYRVEDIDMVGYQMYMTPEKAARGLHLMEYIQDEPDQRVDYPDLRNVRFFKEMSA